MGFIMKTLKAFRASFAEKQIKNERETPGKKQTRYTYTDGPMMYLGQQIVREMQRAGYPAHMFYCFRSFELQDQLYAKGRYGPERHKRKVTRAKAGESPHNYYQAVDIVHPTLFWKVSDDYWQALADCTELVAAKHGVVFDGGFRWGWDLAHVELEDWKDFKRTCDGKPPNKRQLERRFAQVLPTVLKQHKKMNKRQFDAFLKTIEA